MTPCQAQKLHIGSSSVIWSSHGLTLFLISHVALGKSFNRSWCPPKKAKGLQGEFGEMEKHVELPAGCLAPAID